MVKFELLTSMLQTQCSNWASFNFAVLLCNYLEDQTLIKYKQKKRPLAEKTLFITTSRSFCKFIRIEFED